MGGTEALGGIFDDRNIVLFRNGIDPGHVGTLAINADRHDGFGVGGNGCFDQSRINVEGVGLNVYKYGFGVEKRNDFGAGDPGVGDRDHLVTRADIKGHEGDEEGVGAGGTGDAVVYADKSGEFFFQFFDFRTHDVFAMPKYRVEAKLQFGRINLC